MSAPLDFLEIFAGHLRAAGIRFAITSGMACVHYGLQQTTKDSDWIIAPEDLSKLRDLLTRLEQAHPPWRVSYRQIFGAPLDARFMASGSNASFGNASMTNATAFTPAPGSSSTVPGRATPALCGRLTNRSPNSIIA